MAATLTNAIPALAVVPPCAYNAYGAIIAKGCDPTLECICANKDFSVTLQAIVLQTCSPADIANALSKTAEICVEAVPWLTESRQPEFFGAIITLLILSSIAVLLRFMARKITRQNFGWDDWLILAALIVGYGLTVTGFKLIHIGIGHHQILVPLTSQVPFLKILWVGQFTLPTAVLLVKLSVLLFYYRLFPIREFKIATIVIGIVSGAWWIAFITANLLTCQPIAYWWNKSIPGGHCKNQNEIGYYVTSPPDIITNFAILILPIPSLIKLQMHWAKKLAVVGIFLLGSFAIVGSILRILFIHAVDFRDATWTIVNLGIWINVEVHVGILSACLPLMRPILKPSFFSAACLCFRSSKAHSTRGTERVPDEPDYSGSPGSSFPHTGGAKSLGSNDPEQRQLHAGEDMEMEGGTPLWYRMPTTKDKKMVTADSEETIVPMGEIKVKHDVEWKGERGIAT